MLWERKNRGQGSPLRYDAGMRPLAPQATRRGCGRAAFGLVLPLILAGCSTFRPVQPLAPGETALGVSLGGPLLNTLGTVFPTPILAVSGARGLQSRALGIPWTATGAIDLTAAMFGDLHVEPGLVGYPIVQDTRAPSGAGRPTIAVATSLHVLANRHDSLFAPHVATVASWQLGRTFLAYAGADAAVAIKTPVHPIAGPLGGAEWVTGRSRFGLEVKWLAPYHDVEPLAPGWISPFHHGYFTVLLGYDHHFGGGQ
jgi:hypothetical protein